MTFIFLLLLKWTSICVPAPPNPLCLDHILSLRPTLSLCLSLNPSSGARICSEVSACWKAVFFLTTVTKHLLMWECLLFQIPAVIDDIEVKKDPVLEGKDLR